MLYLARQRNAIATDAAPPIFRKEISSKVPLARQREAAPISVDVTLKRFIDSFCDYEKKRCKLCNEAFVQWHIHTAGIPHSGREGMLLELVRPFCGTPEEQVRQWTRRLVNSTEFGRIPALSHLDSHKRKRRLQYLLRYLKDRGVLRDVFNLSSANNVDAGRTFEFERLEFIGDGVVKYVLNNVINQVFPVSEGGSRGKVANFQFVMDGNEGLARGYDYLELQDLTLSSRVVSKFKSDVVETLFGELQFYIWATELDINTAPVEFPFTSDIYTLRALVQHVLYETAITLFMYHVEYVAGMLQRVVREEQINFVRADPSLLMMQARSGEPRRMQRDHGDEEDFGDDGYHSADRRGATSAAIIPAPTVKLMKTRVARAHLHGGSAASFFESTNYDSYKRVVPIGGLLPRPFAREQLAVIPNYMPHVQRDDAMTQQMRTTAALWSAQLHTDLKREQDGYLPPISSSTVADHLATTSVEAAAYQLSVAPQSKNTATAEALSVPRLKDELLVAELL